MGTGVDEQQGIEIALLPCASPSSPSQHRRWKVKELANSKKIIFVSENAPVCIDISHPKSPPVDVVYAFPCTDAANEQWLWVGEPSADNDSGGKLQSVEFPTMCLGAKNTATDTNRDRDTDTDQALAEPQTYMVLCDDAPAWSYNTATSELSMKAAAGTPSKIKSNNLCMTITGSGPTPKGYHRYRDSWMTYTHYRENGEMVDDVKFLDQDVGRLGVGQYDARWSRIEAEWFMNATNTDPTHSPAGSLPMQVELAASIPGANASAALFGVTFPSQEKGGPRPLLVFPNVMHLPQQATAGANRTLTLRFDCCPQGGKVTLFSYSTLFAATVRSGGVHGAAGGTSRLEGARVGMRSDGSGGVQVLGTYVCPQNNGMPFTASLQYNVDQVGAGGGGGMYFTYNSDDVTRLVGGGGGSSGEERAMVLDWFNLTLTPA